MNTKARVVLIIAGIVLLTATILGIVKAGIVGENIYKIIDLNFGFYGFYLAFSIIIILFLGAAHGQNLWKKKLLWTLLLSNVFLQLLVGYLDLDSYGAGLFGGKYGSYIYKNLFEYIGLAGIILIMLASLYLIIYLTFKNRPFIWLWLQVKKLFTIEDDYNYDDNLKEVNKKKKKELKEKKQAIKANKQVQNENKKVKSANEKKNKLEVDGLVKKDETLSKKIWSKIFEEDIDEKEPEMKKEVPISGDILAGIDSFKPNEKSNEAKSEQDEIVSSLDKDENDYSRPSIELLGETNNEEEIYQGLQNEAKIKGEQLVESLAMYNLEVSLEKITVGPNITRYELKPKAGTKVNKFTTLSNDLALVLAAKSIRIEAPIPGKSLIGIEVPNSRTMTVQLSEIWNTSANQKDNFLQVALGKDVNGKPVFMDITKTPHLLVAGSTGSGKSVCINTIIISMLLKASPKELRLVMIDPKKVELYQYNDIPHLMTPVVVEPKKAAAVLQKIVAEMEMRYELFAETKTRNIASYNQKIGAGKKLPYIIVLIDELADLMMVAASDVENSIARIAQMARAAGIHLIIATQRPSTDVITGLIKANIPTRISFSVSSNVDSRTILDASGAEKLLGKGDMLYSLAGSSNLTRVQGVYLDDDEIEKIIEDIARKNKGIISPDEEELISVEEISELVNSEELDTLYEEAKELIIDAGRASTSLLQRRLKIGFNRASRIIEQLEMNEVISAAEGTKPRKVLVSYDAE